MRRSSAALFALSLLIALGLAGACGRDEEASVQFYAAASLADAAQELAQVWSQQEGVEVLPVLDKPPKMVSPDKTVSSRTHYCNISINRDGP